MKKCRIMPFTVVVNSLLLFFLIMVSSVFGEPEKWGKVTEDEWMVGVPEEYPASEAVVIFDKGHVEWKSMNLSFKRHLRIKVLTEEGAISAGILSIELAKYDHLGKLLGQVIRPDGTIIELDKKKVSKSKIGGLQILDALLEGAHLGDVIDWYYEIDYYGGYDQLGPMRLFVLAMRYKESIDKSSAFLESYSRNRDNDLVKKVRNLPTWYFDSPYFTIESELKVDLKTPVHYSFYPSHLPDDKVEPLYDEMWHGQHKFYMWSLQSIPPHSSTRSDRVAIYFNLISTVTNIGNLEQKVYADDYWLQIGKGLRAYLKEYCKKAGSCRKKARTLIEDSSSDLGKLNLIYDYVVREYNQDALLVDLRPENWKVDNFYEKKVGAAFEVNILLLEMLKAVEISAWPIFISTEGRVSFRNTGHFNHMIVLADIESGAVFLDACMDECVAGVLPPFSNALEGFLVGDELFKFCRIMASECRVPDFIESDVP